MPTFTFEETEILCISTGETRAKRILCLEQIQAYFQDEESALKALIGSVIVKLSRMTDAQFDELQPSLISDLDEQEK